MAQPFQQLRNVSGGWLQELREFIARSSALDLAVGVSMGGAFTELVRSFTRNVVTPPLHALSQSATQAARDAAGNLLPIAPPTGLSAFAQQGFDFAVVALTAFLVAKFVNRFKRALEARAQNVSPKSNAAPAVEDPTVRQIAQNERIIALLESLVAQQNKPL